MRITHGVQPILRSKDVLQATGLSRTSIWRGVKNGSFPAAIKLSANAVGWYAHEIESWLASRPRVGG